MLFGSQRQEQSWRSIYLWLAPWVLHVVVVVSSILLEGLRQQGGELLSSMLLGAEISSPANQTGQSDENIPLVVFIRCCMLQDGWHFRR